MMGEKLVQPDLRTEHDGGEHATSRTAQTSSGRVRFTTAMLTLLNLFFTWLVCRYVPSTPGAFRVPAVAAHARMHSYFSACFAAFAGLVCLGSYVSPDKAVGRGNDVGLGIAVSACVCYLLPVLRWAPVLLSAAGKAPLHPHRNVTWCFTTSMLSYSLWTGSSNNPPWELYVSWVGNALCMLAGVPSACSNGFWLWFWYTGSCAALVATGVMQWRFVGRALEDVSDLPRTYNALQRLRFLFLLAWLSFPASFALQFTGLVSGNVGEFLLSFADLFSKGVLQAAYAQGVAVSAEDRRHLRLQLISTSLVKELQEKERQKDLFVASLVHELRTPLNGIIGITESLLSTEKNSFSEKCFQALTTVCETGHRFSQLINDILDNASLQENALKLVFQRVNVHILLSESLHLITPLVNPKEVKVVLSMPPELPIIEGDFNRLVQVMFNLLCNASKFTLKGKITVTAKEENKMIRIDVRDTGV